MTKVNKSHVLVGEDLPSLFMSSVYSCKELRPLLQLQFLERLNISNDCWKKVLESYKVELVISVDQYLLLMKMVGFMLKNIQPMTRKCFRTTWDIAKEVAVGVTGLLLQSLES